jgi:hypothetical protein
MANVAKARTACSAKNRWGDPCWAAPSEKNPLHDRLPLCWAHAAMLVLEQRQQRGRPIAPERVLSLVKVGA